MTTRNTFLAPCAALVLLSACGPAPVAPLADSPQWIEAQKARQFVESGKSLGRAQAEDVERHLDEHPDDLVARQKLLIFYAANGTRFYDPEIVVAARRKHILWMIAHHPEEPWLGQSPGLLNPPLDQIADPDGYAQAKKLWLALVAKPDVPVAVLSNAAAFLADADTPLAEKLEPQGHWPERLANARHKPADGSPAALALQAQSSYDQGDQAGYDAARKSAQDVLRQAPNLGGDPDGGTAIFQANMVLGLLAMQNHDRKAAVKYMLDAGNAPSTEALAYTEQPITYRLPSWLLKDGERDTVIQFLERFAKTSIVSRQELLDSAALIRKGQKPAWYPTAPQS